MSEIAELQKTIREMSRDYLARIEQLEREKTALALKNRKLLAEIKELKMKTGDKVDMSHTPIEDFTKIITHETAISAKALRQIVQRGGGKEWIEAQIADYLYAMISDHQDRWYDWLNGITAQPHMEK